MVLVTVLGEVLVQTYLKWHSRAASINEFRKATAEAVIREYSATRTVRRLIRATCDQGPARSEIASVVMEHGKGETVQYRNSLSLLT